MSERYKVSLVIPCYHEQDGIQELVKALNVYFAEHTEFDAEVIFVDDGSKDRTSEEIKKAGHRGYQARLVRLAANAGSHNAFRAGIAASKGDYITMLSADLQHPISLVHEQLDAMLKGNVKLVLAHRKNPPTRSWFERTFSGFAVKAIRKYSVPNYPENGCDVFMISKEIARLLDKQEEPNSPVILQVLHFGHRYETITYQKQDRFAGKSKWTLSKKIKLFIDSILGFSYAPMRLVTTVGIAFFVIGILWTIYIVSRKLLFNDVFQGWTFLSSILFIGFGITNISIGIIAEYLWRTFDAARRRPAYIVDEVWES